MARELDLDPMLEDAARRRLTELGEAFAVLPAVDPAVPLAVGPAVPEARRPRRRPALVAAAAVVVAVGLIAAAVAAAVSLTGDDDPPAAVAGDCAPRVADDGVVGTGTLPGGSRWELRVRGRAATNTAELIVDGRRQGGWMSDDASWATTVNEGMLPLGVEVMRAGLVVYGQVPRATAVVEILADRPDGREQVIARACPVADPADDLFGYFVTTLDPGTRPASARAVDAQGRALASGMLSMPNLDVVPSSHGTQMEVDPSLVPLPLGGLDTEMPQEPELTPVVSGELPNGSWSLATGRDEDDVVVAQLRVRGGRPASGAEDTADELAERAAWTVVKTGGRLIVWGLAPPDMASVRVTLADGTTVDADTVRAVPDLAVRAFAAVLPEGATATAIDGRRSDGSIVLRAENVADAMAELSGPDAADAVLMSAVTL